LFTPSILTILGVIMYLRFGWMVGNVGLLGALAIVTISTAITFMTALSMSSIATDRRIRAGGAYYMVSRSLGVEKPHRRCRTRLLRSRQVALRRSAWRARNFGRGMLEASRHGIVTNRPGKQLPNRHVTRVT
jgi:hypothetical protein